MMLGALLNVLSTPPSLSQTRNWSEPILLSSNTHMSWFPDLVVDSDGRIHVVYDVGDIPGEDEGTPGLMYTIYDNGTWRQPNDLHMAEQGNISRAAIALDRLGNLHLVRKRGGAGSELDYLRASVKAAHSAGNWDSHVLDDGVIYMSDIVVDSRHVIHVVYEKWIRFDEPLITPNGGEVAELSDIFYRRSADGGRTWSTPVNLSNTPEVGSYRVQLKIDANDVLHLTWDEGWDRWALHGEPRQGVYRHSTDGGLTWSRQIRFSEPEHTNAQMAAASDNRGNVLAVWRPTTRNQVYYAWSTDSGFSWSGAQPIPGFHARAYGDTVFDAYDMAADSAGSIHLVAVGRTFLPAPGRDVVPLGVYHLVWDGAAWSDPEPIALYEPEIGFPEYPKLTISEGNQLHVVWFVRAQQFGGEDLRIFYSHSQSQSPGQTPVPTPTPTPTSLPTPTSVPPPTATPWPTVDPATSGIPSGLYTETDDVLRLLIAILPLGVLASLLIAIKLGWIRRLVSR